MKKILIFSWTAVLLIILFFCIKSFFHKEEPDTTCQKKDIHQESFTPATFEQLKLSGKYVLLTITSEGCDACELIRHNPVLEQFPLTPCFLEREFCPNNMLVSQALQVHGFPSSYLFDEQQNIVGYFRGAAHVEENLHTLLLKKDEIPTDTLQALTYAFKSLVAYLNNESQLVYHYARESMDYQSYFFNNYLLYKYHQDIQQNDSAGIYKTKALQSLEGADIFIYETLVRELAPAHPMLSWIEETTHVHDTNCRHGYPTPETQHQTNH